MQESLICDILNLRWAVYKLGAAQGAWHLLSDEDVKGFMDFLFPKSKNIAYYNMMRNIVLCSDVIKSLPLNSYNLFKFPEQIEESLLDYQKKHLHKDFASTHESPQEVLNRLATIVTDRSIISASIGSLDEIGLNNVIGILAYKYKDSFSNNLIINPFFV